jgi:hypothetical protein
MPDNKEIDSLEIIVRDKSNLPAAKAESLQQWTQERLAEDAGNIYFALNKAIMSHLKITVDDEGKETLPSVKVMELAADMLKARDQGGININQNFGGNTTINNNGTSVSFEDFVRRQQARNGHVETAQDNIIEAEIIDEKEDIKDRESNDGVQEGQASQRVEKRPRSKKS